MSRAWLEAMSDSDDNLARRDVEAHLRTSLRLACVASRAWAYRFSREREACRIVVATLFPNGFTMPWERAVWRVQLANAILDRDHVPDPDPAYDVSDNENY